MRIVPQAAIKLIPYHDMVFNRLSVRPFVDFLASFQNVLIVSILLRIILILYSEWHDAHSAVKYTDIDYRVFSDAARFILHPGPENKAQGILGAALGVGDPYTRQTYRYTPLLALLLLPNEWIHISFGKYLFAGCDILAGILIYKLLVSTVLPPVRKPSSDNSSPSSITRQASLLTSIHLLNPLVFSISTRGSSESVLALFVLLTLYCALERKWTLTALALGLSTHWKIYPFIYGVACIGVIGNEHGVGKGWKGWLRSVVNWRTVKFGLISAASFVGLNVLMYLIWGYPFLYESYLYHLHRRDHRHNFSPYFYLIYLTYPFPGGSIPELTFWRQVIRSPLTSFLPQMILSLGGGLVFGRSKRHLTFAWFVQTFVFVIFNRVCTSQYFLWYTLFLPLLIPQLKMTARWATIYTAVWFGAQALWLSEAYKLEFIGEHVFFGLWVRGLIYMVAHTWVLAGVMNAYHG